MHEAKATIYYPIVYECTIGCDSRCSSNVHIGKVPSEPTGSYLAAIAPHSTLTLWYGLIRHQSRQELVTRKQTLSRSASIGHMEADIRPQHATIHNAGSRFTCSPVCVISHALDVEE